MVERMLPLYDEAQQALATDLTTVPVEAKVGMAKRKMAASDFLAAFAPVLFPEDDDDG